MTKQDHEGLNQVIANWTAAPRGQRAGAAWSRALILLLTAASFAFGQTPPPTQPTKEYIRLGNRVIAIENAGTPAPTLTTINPSSAAAGSAGFTLTVTGTFFASGSTVQWNSSALVTTFVSATQLTALVPAGDLVNGATTASVTVLNPPPSGSTNGVSSGSLTFTINNDLPAITSISPVGAPLGAASLSLTVVGSGFTSTSVVNWNGSSRSTTFVSSTLLTAAILSTDLAAPGSATVTVTNPPPGGGTSGGATFTVSNLPAGYSYASVVTISHTRVSNSDQTNFPVVISGTYQNLATVANGGHVQNTVTLNGNAVPADLIFTSDPAGANLLSWEVASYTPSSGQIEIWIKIPTLSHTVDTVIYMWYGNPLVTAYQCTPTAVWDSNFVVVYHMSSSVGGRIADSTSHGALIGTSATVVAGEIGPGAGTSPQHNLGVADGPEPLPSVAAVRTSEMWFLANLASSTTIAALGGWGSSIFQGGRWVHVYNGDNHLTLDVEGATAKFPWTYDTNWHHLVYTLPSGTTTGSILGYLDGAPQAMTATGTEQIATNTGQDGAQELLLGDYPEAAGAAPFTGTLDEYRISNIARSADWIATEFNNQSNPGTFSSFAPATVMPSITAISPNYLTETWPTFTLTVTGSNFLAGASVQWNGNPLTTTFVSSTQLTASVPAANVATAGTASVNVINPEPGYGTSNSLTFTINASNPAPTITTIFPAAVTATTGAFTLTVNGTGFEPNSSVQWNGSARTTTMISTTQLTAAITSADIASAGSATVTVVTPVPGGGTSNAATLTINPLAAASGYGAEAVITLNGSQIYANYPGILNNFPILITGTYPFLATAANGGKIQNLTNLNGQTVPADLIFTLDQPGATLLSWEVASYNPVTGQVEIWVNVPTLYSQNSATIYMFYGNSSVTTYQCRAVSTWNSNYLMVQHMSNGVTLSLSDSTGNGLTAVTNGSTPTTGVIGGGAAFSRANNQLQDYGTASVLNPGVISVQAWVNATDFAASSNKNAVVTREGSSPNHTGSWALWLDNNGIVNMSIYNADNGGPITCSGGTVTPGSWHAIAMEFNADTWTYLDGVNTCDNVVGSIGMGPNVYHTMVGNSFYPNELWNGSIDEVRISNTSHGTGWYRTEYNNVSSPTTFYTLVASAPTITSLSPSRATPSSGSFTLTVNGANYLSNAVVQWNGTSLSTGFVNSTQLTATVPAADITALGSVTVTVVNGAPVPGTSNGATFSINYPLPVLTTISPNSIYAATTSSSFTITLTGSGFISSSQVQWNGANRATTYVSGTQLTATILASDIAAVGTASVTVVNPSPGGGTSSPATFTILTVPPPVISSLTPATTDAGTATFTLTVNGTGFVTNSQVQWNGSNRATTYVSSTQLTATILTADVATAGTATVTVENFPPGGGTSAGATFTVTPTVYSYQNTITIDHNKVGNSDSLNFPMVFSGTYSFLANTANGGNVSNVNGYDIIFTTDSACANKVPGWEIESYNATTGAVAFWINVPDVSHTVDTTIYMCYGNSTVTLFQSIPQATWDGNFAAVYHFSKNGALSLADSTTNNNLLTNTNATAGTGQISGAIATNGGQYANNSSPVGFATTDSLRTMETWFNTSDTAGTDAFSYGANNFGGNRIGLYLSGTALGAEGAGPTTYATFTNDGKWHHLAAVVPAGGSTFGSILIYVDGVPQTVAYTNPTTTLNESTPSITVGAIAGATYAGQWKGLVDESRMSTIARSADWITAEFNNQSSPTTFYVVSNVTTPTITSLTPPAAYVNTSVTINGIDFGATQGSSTVTFNGTAATVTSWSPTSIVATVPATATTGNVVAVISGITTNAKLFTVIPPNVAPSLTSISPTSATVGASGFTLTLTGTGFISTSQVQWNGSIRSTTYVSSTQLTAVITAADLATEGTPSVTVVNPAPGGGTTAGVTLTINGLAPTLTSISPSFAVAGGATLTLTVTGTKFVSSSVVNWNGSPRTTTFVSATQLTAAINAADIASGGTGTVTVTNPPPGGGTSSAATLTIVSPGSSYAYSAMIAIPHGQVAGTLSSFPALISGTYSFLATTANNGKIQNTTTLHSQTVPADLIFTSDAAGTNLLSWEVASYNATSGQIEVWVNIPTLSSTADTLIYMWYGNAASTTYQCVASSTWDQYYSAVYHFGNGTTLSLADSTSNGNNLTNSGAGATSGKVGGAISTNGTWANTSSTTDLPPGSTMRTLEAWVNPTSLSGSDAFGYGANSANGGRFALTVSGDTLGVEEENTSASTPIPGAGAWHHLVAELPSGTTSGSVQLYLDGQAATASYSNPSFTLNSSTANITVGSIPGALGNGNWNGLVDEARISTIARSAAWVTTEYNNQSGPTLFSEVIAAGTVPLITSLSPPSIAATSPSFTLTVTGTSFAPGAVVQWNGSPRSTTWVGATQLTATITAADVASAGTATITVANPAPYSGTSAGTAFPIPYPGTSYTSSSTVTFHHGQVSGTNQFFPALITGTYSNLATAANGGALQNTVLVNSLTVPADLVFTSDAAGLNFLPWEVASYQPSTGQIEVWVQIPTLSNAADTTIYMWYGNTAVTTFQSTPSTTWDSNYMGVWHFGNNALLDLNDSTANTNNGTDQGATDTSGYIGGGAAFNGSNQYVSVNNSSSLQSSQNVTASAWIYAASSLTTNHTGVISKGTGTSAHDYLFGFYNKELKFSCNNGGGWSNLYSTVAPTLNTWNAVTWVWRSGNTVDFYLNGQFQQTVTGASCAVTTSPLYFGETSPTSSDNKFPGDLDEIRLSRIARSANWIATEYNNQNSPTTFYTLGALPAITGLSPTLGLPPTSVTISGSNFGATKGSSTVTFNGTVATPTSWSATSIVVPVPSAATTGNVVVTVGGVASNGQLFTVAAPQYQLTTAASPVAGGTVTPASGPFNTGSVVNLSATANSGYQFLNWTGPVANPNAASTTVTMTAAESVTANFQQLSSVTVTTSPSGLSFTVDGNAYTASQTFTWIVGSSHTVTTTSPQAGGAGTQYVFSTWSDSGAQSHTIAAPSSTTTYTANFTTQYQLTTATSPAAGGTVTPASGSYYTAGTVVNISATANSGYQFVNWTGPAANTNSAATTVTMSAPVSVTANVGVTSSITVTTSPSGLSFTVDGAAYTAAQTFTWVVGSSHTVATPSPQAGGTGTQYAFNTWSDGGAQSHTITAPSSATTYTVNFSTQYQLTLIDSPVAGGTVPQTGNGWYLAGSTVLLDAVPNSGYIFVNWTGAPVQLASGPAVPAFVSVAMTGPITLTANFTPVTVWIAESYSGVGTAPYFTVDGADLDYRSTQAFAWPVGSSHTLATVTPQLYQKGKTVYAGYQYVFDNWSDGGAVTHTIVVPPTPTTYTLTFDMQCQLTIAPSDPTQGSVTPATGSWSNQGTVVNITATPNAGYQFVNWTGSVADPNSATTTVTMSTPQTVTANFAPSEDVEFANLLARVSNGTSQEVGALTNSGAAINGTQGTRFDATPRGALLRPPSSSTAAPHRVRSQIASSEEESWQR
jgi:hypothetical protein